MKKLLLILLIATPAFAGKSSNFKDSALNQEWDRNYYEHSFPTWVNARGSSATITYIKTSTITAISGNVTTLSGTQLTYTTGTIPSFMVTGTTTNDDAPAGRFGEYLSSFTVVGTALSGSNGVFQDLLILTLTAGDWTVTGMAAQNHSCAIVNDFHVGISTTSGNSNAGLRAGVTWMAKGDSATGGDAPSAFTFASCQIPIVIPDVRFSVSASTLVYLKVKSDFASGAPGSYGSMTARRIR